MCVCVCDDYYMTAQALSNLEALLTDLQMFIFLSAVHVLNDGGVGGGHG